MRETYRLLINFWPSVDPAAAARLRQLREDIVQNFKERMQLRRSLIEIEGINVQNNREIARREAVVMRWRRARQRR